MTEIKLQKKRPSLLPLVLAALIVALLLWWWLGRDGAEVDASSIAEPAPPGVVEPAPAP